ncbi:MAG: uridine kinase [Actinobacteria bacterium]|nr:uridine kinase [Actinomycetota bacterium]
MRSQELVHMLAERCPAQGRFVLGIDGPDAAGKTTLAEAVGDLLGPRAVRASIDGFHRPAAVRHAVPYENGFDVERLASGLLRPFRVGAGEVLVRAYDHVADAPREAVSRVAADAVLVLDGVFLGQVQPELDLWVFLEVPPEVTLSRAAARDADFQEVLYRERYLPAQARYRPTVRADVVVDNSDPASPRLVP